MTAQPLPREVSDFLTDHISSVVELEALLLLHAAKDRQWRASDIARELRIDPAWTAQQLQALCSGGILNCIDGADPLFSYAPRDPNLDQTIGLLAREYAERRVTIIGLIFSKPTDTLKSFADAFRIRKDPPK